MVQYTSEMLEQLSWWEESRPSDNALYADGVSYQAYYSEVGKAHYMGKDLTEVRSPQRSRAGAIRANLTAGNSN